jgi:hypothetical protein
MSETFQMSPFVFANRAMHAVEITSVILDKVAEVLKDSEGVDVRALTLDHRIVHLGYPAGIKIFCRSAVTARAVIMIEYGYLSLSDARIVEVKVGEWDCTDESEIFEHIKPSFGESILVNALKATLKAIDAVSDGNARIVRGTVLISGNLPVGEALHSDLRA